MTTATAHPVQEALRPERTRGQKLRQFVGQNKVGAIAGCILLIVIIAGLFSEQLSPYFYDDQNGPRLTGPSLSHPLGTDQLGRDLLSRVMVGARASLLVGFGVSLLATSLGTIVGIASAYNRGWIDTAVQRLIDAMMAIPPIFIALALISAFATTSLILVVVAISFASFPRITRIMRSTALSIAAEQYIESARSVGAGGSRIMLFHILPNVFPYALVLATILLGNAILVEATLSFLGLGVQPPTPSWGGMLSGSVRTYMLQEPWLAFPPGIALTVTVLSFNLFGDALRDHFDPRLRNR